MSLLRRNTPLHSRIMSACSTPIFSSSTTSSPVAHTSMLPSPPREAASPSLISLIVPVVPMTAMKEEDITDNSRMMPSMTPTVVTYSGLSGSYRAYVSDDPEHVDDCCNCGLPHVWDREGAESKDLLLAQTAKDAQSVHDAGWLLAQEEPDKEEEDQLIGTNFNEPKIEIQITIVVKSSPDEGMKGGELKNKSSKGNGHRCYYCNNVGHLQWQCPRCIENKKQGADCIKKMNKRWYKKSTLKNLGNRIQIQVVSDPGDYNNEEADLLRSRPTCHGIRRTVIDTARESLVFRFFCIILRLDPCRTGPLPPH